MEVMEREAGEADRQAQIEALVRQLSETEHALQELLAGEVDAVVDPVRGTPIILRQAQVELRRSEARTRMLLEQVPAVVWTTDTDLRMTSMAGREMAELGMTPDRAVETSLPEAARERPGLAGVLAAHYRALEGQRASYEARVDERVFHGTVEPLWDENRRIVGCVGLGLDVTRQRNLEDVLGGELRGARQKLEALVERTGELAPEHRTLAQEVLEASFTAIEELQVTGEELHLQNEELVAVHNELETSRRRYRDLFQSAPDGYLVTDPAGIVRRANQAAEELLGARETLLRDKPLVLYVTEGERAEFHRKLNRVRAGESAGGMEWELRMRSHAREGDVFPAALTVSPIHDTTGEVTGLRWLLRDISPSKRAEERERLLEEVRTAAEEAQAANTLLRTLLNVMPVGVVVCNEDGALLMTNPPGQEILGERVYGTVEAPKRNYTAHYPDGTPFPASEMPLARALQLGETVEGVEILIRREDGSERTILAGAAPVHDELGRIISGVTVFQDITGRKQLEKDIDAERARLRAIFESAPEGIVMADTQARVVLTNPAADRLYARSVPYGKDYQSHAALALCTAEGVPCDPRDLPLTRAALDGDVVVNENMAIVWPDGQRRDLLVNAAPVRGNRGEILGAVGLFQDITELRRAELALRKSEARYRELFDTSRDGLVFTDMEGRFLQCNPAYLELLGYETFEELCGQSYEEVTPPEYHALEERIIREQTLARGYSDAYEKEYIRKTGERIPVSVKGWLRFDDAGKPVGMWVIVRDITARRRAEEALRRERNLLNTVMENTHAQLAYLDADFDFLMVNAAYAEGAGYGEEALIGHNHFELFPHAENQAIFERVRDTGEPVAFHARPFVFSEQPERGTTYWDWTLVPVQENGRVSGLVFSLVDVTEQEQARRALRRYAERLRGLYQTSQSTLTAHSLDDLTTAIPRLVPGLLDCVRADVMLYDFEAGTMTLMTAHTAAETDVDTGWRAPLDMAWVSALQTSADGVYLIEDVQQAPATSAWQAALQAEHVRALLAVPLFIDGVLAGSLNLGMDAPGPVRPDKIEIAQELATQLTLGIQQVRLREQVQRYTEDLEEKVRRRTAALRASNTRFRVIFEDAAIGIALIDRHTHVVASNPSLHTMLGYSADELKGLELTKLSHPDIVESDAQLYRELLEGQRRHYQVEGRYVHKEGHPIDVNVVVSLVQQHTVGARYAIVMIEDISEKKAAQTALIQSEKLALTGKLAASLAHEINNPLQSVVGFLSLVEETLASDKETRHYVRIAIDEIKRAAGLVRQLRNINQPVQDEEKQASDINALLEQMLSLSRKKCRDQRVEVVWEPDGEIPAILAIPNRLHQVFLNLVLNALEAMPEGGTLHISTARTADPAGVEIRFVDTGVGISGDQIHNLFKPFYTTKDAGLGLGLYVSHEIIQSHGGYIGAESVAEEGATFIVWLPAARG